MSTPRMILGKTRKDRVQNKDILMQSYIQDVEKSTKKHWKRWYKHIDTMNEQRLVKEARETYPQEKTWDELQNAGGNAGHPIRKNNKTDIMNMR